MRRRLLPVTVAALMALDLAVAAPISAGPDVEILAPVWDDESAVLDRIVEEELRRHLSVLTHLPDRVAGTFGEHWAAVYIASRSPRRVLEREQVPLAGGGTSQNLWFTLGEGNTRLLLGAHYDSVAGSPGADDNASGVAVLLALALHLGVDPPQNVAVTLAFFGAEEWERDASGNRLAHHQGSRLRARTLADEGRLPDYMVSVDMVGVGNQIVAVAFEDGDPAAARLLSEAAARIGQAVGVESRGDVSDHEAFGRVDVPSAFLWRPDNPNYHGPGDDVVRMEALLEDVEILLALIDILDEEGDVAVSAASLGRYRPARR